LTELAVREGQLVKKGDLIVRLNDDELQIQLERAQIEHQIAAMAAESQVDIEYARKSRDVAAADLQRSEQANLRVKNSIPQARIEKQKLEKDRTVLQLEKAQRDFRIAQLNANLAKNEVKNAQSQLNKAKILSPADGMIVSVENQPGEWVEPSQTLARMVRVDRLRIEGFLPAESARLIEVGQPVTINFQPDWIRESVPGKIVFVSPEANPVNLNVQIWAEFDNPEGRFLPGIRGDIMIEPQRNR
jgi:multidrug resistance efflux pump